MQPFGSFWSLLVADFSSLCLEEATIRGYRGKEAIRAYHYRLVTRQYYKKTGARILSIDTVSIKASLALRYFNNMIGP